MDEKINVSAELLESNGNEDSTKPDDQITQLTQRLESEKDKRLEERFVFLVLVLILIDIILLNGATNIMTGVIVLIFEIAILIPISRRLGVEGLTAIFNRMIDAFGKNK